ncbi:hypothetical protein FRZ67_04470 [Panacibacter ginsenosidivorans]|uniref:DUF4595 domain-containing protein n=1 Tax=Panacibacter ginsenosidivorans TaxID=1813871 RepID=A0A5B8V7C1_9BACT|nr:hypothetical protein [Panacibacter ginsenosidivorans]QEC66586.1 hypothetical protein FRZ67_04470 [Panacibacter ginsenosidivorans]
MKFFSLFLVVTSLLFASCQKEDTYPPLGNNTGTLLIKSVAVQNGETSTTTYSYTSDNKIDVISTVGTSGGIDIGDYRKFYRDASGRIVKIAHKIPPQSGVEVDTAFTYVYYPNATTLNYNNTVMKLSVSGFDVNDSTLYTYNGNNQITEGYTYESSPLFGPVQEIRFVYTYDAAGNVTKIEGYNNATGTMQLSVTFDLEYDDKNNPLAFDQEVLLITGGAPGSSKNNVTVAKFKDVNNTDTQTITNTYTYGANGLPEKMVSVDDSDNSTTTTTFYYQ